LTGFDAYLSARWGDGPAEYVSPEDRRKCDVRLDSMWRAIAAITGTSAAAPVTSEVHSSRALPAVLTIGDQRRLVWDAGLGTVLEALAFPLPHPQPRPVVEAMLRRIFAVRYVLAGWPAEASDEVRRAERLLEETPIDRFHQIHADAESQFDVWLLTEMQERFALGHELAHYLHGVDPDGFERCASRIRDVVESLKGADEPGKPVRNLDPYAWYARNRDGDSAVPVRKNWRSRVADVAAALNSSPAIREEITCDVISSLAVGWDAHRRQGGWTAIMGVACSRLALANLGVLLGIDGWIAGSQPAIEVPPAGITTRGECLNLIVPWLLPGVLAGQGTRARGEEDIFEAMLLASERHEGTLGPALAALGAVPPSSDGEVLGTDELLIRAGFLFLRASPDWRSASAAAKQGRDGPGGPRPPRTGG
jgi:hypothetical protein